MQNRILDYLPKEKVLSDEQKHLKSYQESGVIPVEFTYLVWRNGVWPRRGEPKTLEVELKPRSIKYRTIKYKTKHRSVRR